MTDFGLEEITGTSFWKIYGANRVDANRVDLLNGLLPARTQEEHVAHYGEQGRDGFEIGSVPVIYSVAEAMFDNKEGSRYKDGIGRARDFLQKRMRNRFLLTSTRIRNMPEGQRDVVMHNYGLPSMQTIEADIIGHTELIADAKDTEAYTALFGSGDTEKIGRVFRWLNGTDVYLWRVNSKPDRAYETVAGFDANSVRAGLNCYWVPRGSYSALGVRLSAEGTQKI